MEPIMFVTSDGNPEQACGLIFYGDYHYCGESGGGWVMCCLGGELH